MKVICAGLPKTGTKSMAEALRILGYSVHDVFHQFFLEKELWHKVLQSQATREEFRKTFEDVDAVTDAPACAFWEQIAEAFPDAKVILMERSSEDEWFESVKHHYGYMHTLLPFTKNRFLLEIVYFICGPLQKELADFHRDFYPVSLGCTQMWGRASELILRSRYRQHNAYVRLKCPSEKLLLYNVKEGWGPLCKFLNVPIPDKPFPIKNVKASVVRETVFGEFEHDCGYHKTLVRETMVRVTLILGFLISIAGLVACYYFR